MCSTNNDDDRATYSDVHCGPRSFRVVAFQIWNTLPSHLNNIIISHKQFKSGFKNWLFV